MKRNIRTAMCCLIFLCFGISQAFSQEPDSWVRKNDLGISNAGMPPVRSHAVAFSIGTKGYIGTGLYQLTYKKDFWEYDPSSDTWTQKANFGGTARSGAVGFSIGAKGYMGTGYDGSYRNDFWEYDPSSNTWIQKANLGGGVRSGAAGFSIGSKGYIGTGWNDVFMDDFWEYDPASDSWTQKTNLMGSKRSGAIAFSINGKGYIGAGAYVGGTINDLREYDPLLNTWKKKASYPGSFFYNHVGFSIGNKGYVAGANTTEFWEYDPVGNKWFQKANFGGEVRESAIGLSIGNIAYVGFGTYNGVYRRDFWQYDPVVNSWQIKGTVGGYARVNASEFSINGKGYVGWGFSDIYYGDLWEYDPVMNSWTQKANFPGLPRQAAASFSIGSKGYIGTGNNKTVSYMKDFWEYDPGTNSWNQLADFAGTARNSATGFSIGSKGYIGTGYDGDELKDFWEYNPNTDAWTKKANVGGSPRYSAVSFSCGGKGYIGLQEELPNKKDFWEYDPQADTWTKKADFPDQFALGTTGFTIGNKGFVAVGNSGTTDLYQYDPQTNSWTQKNSINESQIQYATGFSINDRGYIGIGMGAVTYVAEFWEYTPDFLITGVIANTSFCPQTNVSVPYSAEIIFNAGNIFTAQLSDSNGSFLNPVNIGTLSSVSSGTIESTIPASAIPGSGYRIRVVSSNPIIIGNENGTDLTIENILVLYQDADGDGYGNADQVLATCDPPGGYVADSTDCNDGNASVNPGAPEVVNGIDDDCNGQVDESFCLAPVGLFTSDITSTSATLQWQAVPEAVKYKLRYKRTVGEGGWIRTLVVGTSRHLESLLSQTEYQWQVRSFCATPYKSSWSAKNYFTTLPLKSADIIQQPLQQLIIYPNPAESEFNVSIFSGEEVNAIATLAVRNILGQSVLVKDIVVESGMVHDQVKMPADVPPGVYWISIIINGKIYSSPLEYQ